MGIKIKICIYEQIKLIKIFNYQLRTNQQDESAGDIDEIQATLNM